jgi:alpha-maltose-1-phosphate synthase
VSEASLSVLHLVPRLFGRHNGGVSGGAERYALELARHMAEETSTSLVCFGDKESYETVGRLNVHVIGDPWCVRGQIYNPFRLRLCSELRKYSIVHCHQQHIVASSVAAMYCRLTGRKVFVTDLGGGGWDISAFMSTDRWYHGQLHISEYSRSISGHSDWNRAHVIFGGVDSARFCPDRSVMKEKRVLFVGRLMPHKGVDDLVKAVPADVTLEIIGHPYHPGFVADLRALAANKRVVFRDNCDDEQLVEAYRRAMCIVLPSVYKTMYGQESKVPELLGQTLLEGMACGTAAICTEVASMPEVVVDGLTGFVVRPNDPDHLGEKIQWFCENESKTITMGEAGRQRVLDKFSWKAVVQRCLNIYAGPVHDG